MPVSVEVQFRARERADVVISSGDEHRAVEQQSCRVEIARGAQTCCGVPSLAHRIVHFRAGKSAAAEKSSGDKNPSIR